VWLGGDVLGVVDALAVLVHLPLRHQRVDDQRRLGVRQRVDVLELAQLELGAGFLVALRRRALAHCAGRVGGHVGGWARRRGSCAGLSMRGAVCDRGDGPGVRLRGVVG